MDTSTIIQAANELRSIDLDNLNDEGKQRVTDLAKTILTAAYALRGVAAQVWTIEERKRLETVQRLWATYAHYRGRNADAIVRYEEACHGIEADGIYLGDSLDVAEAFLSKATAEYRENDAS